MVEGKPTTATCYDVAVVGQALGAATVTHDGVHRGTLRWPETFLFIGDGTDLDYIQVDGQWYRLSGTAQWSNPMSEWRSTLWALLFLPAVLLGYFGTRPAES